MHIVAALTGGVLVWFVWMWCNEAKVGNSLPAVAGGVVDLLSDVASSGMAISLYRQPLSRDRYAVESPLGSVGFPLNRARDGEAAWNAPRPVLFLLSGGRKVAGQCAVFQLF